MRAWFLEMVPVWMSVCVFVCPSLRLLITSGVIRTPYDWLNKFYSRYMEIVVVIVNGRVYINGYGLLVLKRCSKQLYH